MNTPHHVLATRFLNALSLVVWLALGACRDTGMPARLPVASIEEELRLDANAEDFSRVGTVVVGTRGEIIVPQPQDGAIRIYDSGGKRIALVGRRGDAPGEFRDVGQAGLKGDTIWVQDAMAATHTYITPTGEVARVLDLRALMTRIKPADYSRTYLHVIPVGESPDGVMLAGGVRRPTTQNEQSSLELLRISVSGELEPIAVPPGQNDPRWSMSVDGVVRGIPFAQPPIFAIAQDGGRCAVVTTTITGKSGTYNVSVFALNGDTLLSRDYSFRGVSIPQAARDSAIKAESTPNTRGYEGPTPSSASFAGRAAERMPSVYAPVRAVTLGIDGTIWLTLRDAEGMRAHIVLDRDGEELGRVILTTRQKIQQASAKQLWVVELDDNDLPSIVRFRVVGLARPRSQGDGSS